MYTESERFLQWLHSKNNLIDLAVMEGYTKAEAIELLKAWQLGGIAYQLSVTNGNY